MQRRVAPTSHSLVRFAKAGLEIPAVRIFDFNTYIYCSKKILIIKKKHEKELKRKIINRRINNQRVSRSNWNIVEVVQHVEADSKPGSRLTLFRRIQLLWSLSKEVPRHPVAR